MKSIEGYPLPQGVKNIYWYWNKEHALDADKKHRKYRNFYEYKTKKQRQAWWRSLSPEEQQKHIARWKANKQKTAL